MKKLNQEREPYWLDLGDEVRIRVRPIDSTALLLARKAGGEAYIAQGDHDAAAVYGGVAFTRALALWGILEWEGVGDANGEPVPATSDWIDLLLEADFSAFTVIDEQYVAPALRKDAEKNV